MTLFLILKNQSIWTMKITLLYGQINDSFKGHFPFLGYYLGYKYASNRIIFSMHKFIS